MTTTMPDTLVDRLASPLVVVLCVALLTSTALTNICMLLLVLLSLWAWTRFQWPDGEWALAKPLFVLIAAFCLWDLGANLLGGNSLNESFSALRHVRKFFFVLLLWPIFASPKVARYAVLSLGATVTLLATANLVWTLVLHRQGLMTSFMPNLHGQILVGMVLLLVHGVIYRQHQKSLFLGLALLLLSSLFFASDRRTGYVLLAAGSVFMVFLIWQSQTGRRRHFLLAASFAILFAILALAGLSPKVQSRVALAFFEYQQFTHAIVQQKHPIETSVGFRLESYFAALEFVKAHFWLGSGSLKFPELFSQTLQQSISIPLPQLVTNPHNEYLYIWATKGLFGMLIYLSIWVQACRMAARRNETWQRHGMWIFVCLFLTSILFNSMSIDMVEGHFMMLVLLVFLAPSRIWTAGQVDRSAVTC